MSKKKILSLVLAAFMLVGIFAACTPEGNQPPAQQGETPQQQAPAQQPAGTDAQVTPPVEDVQRGMRVAVNAETPSITPGRHTAILGAFKNQLTHNGLFRGTYQLEVVPDLVYSWRAVSDTLFEFTLHEGVLFHNGEELTAYDVVASWYYMRNFPEGMAQHASVIAAAVVDRYTFTFDTGEPNAMMIFDLTHHANSILPASLINSGHDFIADPVGTGPFVFDSWDLGNSLRFTRFDNYFDVDRQPSLEYVEWVIIPEASSRTIALEIGEVDFVAHVAFPDLPRMRDNADITVAEFPGLQLRYIVLNLENPMFQNVYVRRALDMALDKEALVIAGLDGMGIPLWEQFPTILGGISSEGIRSFDPDGARALLAEHNIDPSTISFEMLVISEEWRREAEVAQSNFADIGITTNITMMDTAAWFTQTGTADGWETTFSGFTSSNLLSLMRGTMHYDMVGHQNRSRFYDREFSAIIDQAIATVDVDERNAMLYEMTVFANNNATWIPTAMNMQARAFNSRLHAPELCPTGAINANMIFWTE